MKIVDSFYTPSDLALRLVDHVKNTQIKNVIDFCVGNGELIRAAMKKWPSIKCYGTDISEIAIKEVKIKHPDWVLRKCDFLKDNSRNRCEIIKQNKNGFDLIMLNPPFSCIGGTIYNVTLDRLKFKVSTSMKFLAESLKYLSSKGCLVAIMPISVCYSQKDRKLWNYLVDNYNLTILEAPNGNYFKNCSPSIVFVSINNNQISKPFKTEFKTSLNFSAFKVFRGKISTCDAIQNVRGYPFVHSTNIRNNRLEDLSINVFYKTSEICGPAILIPRVGKPNPQKICVIPKGSYYTLSDCVIAIQTESIMDANEIYICLLGNWDQLKELYKGTGAKFITVERLSNFLGRNKNEDSKILNLSLSDSFTKPQLPFLESSFSEEQPLL